MTYFANSINSAIAKGAIFTTLLFISVSCKKDDPAPAVAAPTASFTFTIMDRGVVQFSSTSTDAKSYLWDFGDGATATSTSPTHTFTSNETFEVKLTVTGPGGSATTSKSVSIVLKAEFTHTLLVNWQIQFANISTNPVTSNWSFGDGSASSEPSPTHTYAAPGTYTVELTVTGTGGTSTISKDIVVQGILVGNWTMGFYRRYNCTDPTKPIPQTTCTGCVMLQITETQITNTTNGGAPVVYNYSINGSTLVLNGSPQNSPMFFFTGSTLLLTFNVKTDIVNTCKYDEFYTKQ